MFKKITYVLLFLILVSCSNLNQNNKLPIVEKTVANKEKEPSHENKNNNEIFRPISKEDIVKKSDYESVFLSLDGKK